MSWLTNLGVPASLTSVIGLGIASVIFKSASSASDPALTQWTPQFLAYAGDLIAPLLLSSLLPMQVSSLLRLRFTLPQVSTTPTRVDQPLVTTLDSGSSFQSSFSSPGPLPFPLLDTLRVLFFGRDTRPWRPPEQLSLLFRDTNTLLLDA